MLSLISFNRTQNSLMYYWKNVYLFIKVVIEVIFHDVVIRGRWLSILDNTLKCTREQRLFKKILCHRRRIETIRRYIVHYLSSQRSEWPYKLQTSKMLFVYRLYNNNLENRKCKNHYLRKGCTDIIGADDLTLSCADVISHFCGKG